MPRRAQRLRPLPVTAVAVTAMILGAMMLTGALLLLTAGTLEGPWGNFHEFGELAFWLPSDTTAAGVVLAIVGAAHVVAGAGLLRRRLWAWWLALALVALQIVSGAAAIARSAWDQAPQAAAYALAGAALLVPRARAWFLDRRPSTRVSQRAP